MRPNEHWLADLRPLQQCLAHVLTHARLRPQPPQIRSPQPAVANPVIPLPPPAAR